MEYYAYFPHEVVDGVCNHTGFFATRAEAHEAAVVYLNDFWPGQWVRENDSQYALNNSKVGDLCLAVIASRFTSELERVEAEIENHTRILADLYKRREALRTAANAAPPPPARPPLLQLAVRRAL